MVIILYYSDSTLIYRDRVKVLTGPREEVVPHILTQLKYTNMDGCKIFMLVNVDLNHPNVKS